MATGWSSVSRFAIFEINVNIREHIDKLQCSVEKKFPRTTWEKFTFNNFHGESLLRFMIQLFIHFCISNYIIHEYLLNVNKQKVTELSINRLFIDGKLQSDSSNIYKGTEEKWPERENG